MNRRIQYLIGLFIFWPFAAFILSLKNGFSYRSRIIITLFGFIFGYSVFVVGGDISRYEVAFDIVSEFSWSDYIESVSGLYSPKQEGTPFVAAKPDLYALTLQFVISRFTENPRWFWGFASLIYTWLFLLVLKEIKLYSNINTRDYIFYILLLTIIFLVPFYRGVSGVRFWTAFYLFLLYLFRYMRLKQTRYLTYLFICSFIHYTFLFPALIIQLVRVINHKSSKYIVFTSIIFYFISSAGGMFDIIGDIINIFDDTSIKSSAAVYTNYSRYEKLQEGFKGPNWYVTLNYEALPIILIFLYGLERLKIIKLSENVLTKKMLPTIDILFAISILTINLSFALGRFQYLFMFILLARYTSLYILNINIFKFYSLVFLPLLILNILVTFRAGFYFVDPLLLISNPIVLFLFHSETSLSEIIVGH